MLACFVPNKNGCQRNTTKDSRCCVAILSGIHDTGIYNMSTGNLCRSCILFSTQTVTCNIQHLNGGIQLRILKKQQKLPLQSVQSDLRKICDKLYSVYEVQLMVHLSCATLLFTLWHKATYYWCIFGVDFCVCYLRFFYFLGHERKSFRKYLVPQDMGRNEILKGLIKEWKIYTGYYFVQFLIVGTV